MASMKELTKRYIAKAREIDEARREQKNYRLVEGEPFWPHEVVRDMITISWLMAILLFLAALVPTPLFAPFDPNVVPEPVPPPDWYLLWTFGILQFAAPLIERVQTLTTIDLSQVEAPFLGQLSQGFPFSATLNGTVLGIQMHLILILLVLVPFLHRGEARRPVESPGWAAFGVWALGLGIMFSVYSVVGPITIYYPIFEAWMVELLVYLVPLMAAIATYIPLNYVRTVGGYETDLNRRFYIIRRST